MSQAPSRTIVSFYQDEEGHWTAELSCGHGRHMRHRPPLEQRPWVLHAATRAPIIGTPIPCLKCLDSP